MYRTTALTRCLALCLVVSMAACTTWQPYTLPPDGSLPTRLRLESHDGEQVIVRRPTLEGDSALVGIARRQRHRVLLDQIQGMEHQHTHVVRSVVTGVVLGLALFVVVGSAVDPWEGPTWRR